MIEVFFSFPTVVLGVAPPEASRRAGFSKGLTQREREPQQLEMEQQVYRTIGCENTLRKIWLGLF